MARYVITGATRGIGRALVDLLAADHELIAVGRASAELTALPVARSIVADLGDRRRWPASFPSSNTSTGSSTAPGWLRGPTWPTPTSSGGTGTWP